MTAIGPSFLQVRDLSKSFGEHKVLCSLSLEIAQAEFFTLLGPSGSGKSTLLRLLAGLEKPDQGLITLAGKDLTHVPPERRPFNMVFQSYALFPHMNVWENVAYGLRAAGVPPRQASVRISSMLELVNLAGLSAQSVRKLSGGQQQRVALARALVNEPEVLLLDEPLGALDLQLRKRLQDELRRIQSRLGTTFVYVTHDQDEALTMSHRIGLMNHGELVQVGTARELYDAPASRFAAEFIGEANLIACRVDEIRRGVALVCLTDSSNARFRCNSSADFRSGDHAVAVIRPEHLRFTNDGIFRGEAVATVFRGAHCHHDVRLAGGSLLRVLTSAGEAHRVGESVQLDVAEAVLVPREEG